MKPYYPKENTDRFTKIMLALGTTAILCCTKPSEKVSEKSMQENKKDTTTVVSKPHPYPVSKIFDPASQ